VEPIGIQDVFLGDSIGKFKDRLGYQDSMVTPNKTMMHWIKLKKSILDDCRGNFDQVMAITYHGRIMGLETKFGCLDGINELFIQKFGKPTVNIGGMLEWELEGAKIIIRLTGEHYGSRPETEIVFTSITLYEDYYRKNATKGNI